MGISKSALALVVLLALGVSSAASVDQGAPGTQGPWPIRPGPCVNPKPKDTTVGTSAVPCPATRAAGARFMILCNSAENTSGGKVKVRYDGTAPVMGVGNPGEVLTAGQCLNLWLAPSTAPQCISDQASTHVTTTECSQQ